MYKTTLNNFAPRIGVAYQLFQRQRRETVLRGGFGIFFDVGNTTVLYNFTSSFPFILRQTLSNVQYPVDPALLVPPIIAPGTPIGTLFAADPNLKLPYTYQWNLAMEQSLGNNQTFSASYLGAAGRRLLRHEVFSNPVFSNPSPNFTQIRLTRGSGSSDYHAMQLQFQRRLSLDLQALASYSWSHSIDDASSDFVGLAPSENLDPSHNRGPSDFDVRHAFTGAITYNIPTAEFGRIGNALLRDSLDRHPPKLYPATYLAELRSGQEAQRSAVSASD